jgi:hypothetical protein
MISSFNFRVQPEGYPMRVISGSEISILISTRYSLLDTVKHISNYPKNHARPTETWSPAPLEKKKYSDGQHDAG